MTWQETFVKDPLRGAEYMGEITPICIMFNEPEAAGARAQMAAHFAHRHQRSAIAKKAGIASGAARARKAKGK